MTKQKITVTKRNYYDILGRAQNKKENQNSDIMSFTALMDWQGKLQHLAHYMPEVEIINGEEK